MPRKCGCVAFVAIFALAASRSAQAQVTVDVTNGDCVSLCRWLLIRISRPRGGVVTQRSANSITAIPPRSEASQIIRKNRA
jgi:hypothetical protein